MKVEKPKAALIYNTADYLLRFRTELIQGLQERGYDVIAIVPFSEPAISKLKELNVRCEDLAVDGQRIRPVGDIRLFLSLFALFRREKPDLILSFTIKPVIYGSLAGYLAGIRNVNSMITGLGYVFIREDFLGMLLRCFVWMQYRFSLKVNRKVFFQNPDDLSIFLEKSVVRPLQAVLINGSGVDLMKFRPDRMRRPQVKVFVLVARMNWHKGVGEFVEAARRIKLDDPDVEFWLVGKIDSGPAAVSHEQIEDWRREGVVRYKGHVENIQDILSMAYAFVLPSYREGTPRSVLEAMACGLPIITTDTPGCRETVIDRESGFLVPPRNVEVLEKSIRLLVKNPEMSIRMGEVSRRLAQEKYDVHKVTSVILSNIVGK